MSITIKKGGRSEILPLSYAGKRLGVAFHEVIHEGSLILAIIELRALALLRVPGRYKNHVSQSEDWTMSNAKIKVYKVSI